MTIRRSWIPTVLAAPVCALFAANANPAEPASSLAERQWEELVVVASHLPRPAREVGSAVTVLTGRDLRVRKLNLASEVLREVPGVAVNRTGQEGELTQVRIRGAEANHTLVLIDGIEANDPAFGSEFDFASLLTWDMGRIEVLRGPQSALYGSDSIGGVVNISTIEPEAGFSARSEVEAGSFGTTQLGASISGASERVSALLSASWYDTDGISSSALPGEEEKDGFENTTAHGKVTLALNDDFDLRLVLRQQDNEVETDAQDFTPGSPTQGLVVDADNHTESRQRYGLVELDGAVLDDRWMHRLAYGHTDTESDSYATGVRTSGSRGERRKIEYETTLLFGEDRLEHTLTGGVEREQLEFENVIHAADEDQTSYVAEYALTYREATSMSVSVRRDENDRFDDATTFRTTGSHLFTATGTRVHASYGEGVTDPSFTELFGFDPDTFVGNPNLEPEKSDGWDVGVEQSLAGGRALVDVTYFNATLEDEIITVFDSSFMSSPINQDGESDREGVEIRGSAQLGADWTLDASYTYLDATEPDGLEEVRRPRHSGSVNVNYAFLGGRGNANLGARFNGEQEDSEFVAATPGTRVTLDDYTLVNLTVSFDVTERVQVFARGENLLDENYTEVFGYRSPGAAGYAGVRAML